MTENQPVIKLKAQPKRPKASRSARILFLYPNERGMSTVPPAIAILSQVLKDAGHITSIFDTTFYLFDDEISIAGFNSEKTDADMTKSLNYRPVAEDDDEQLYFKKTTGTAAEDFRALISEFKPDLVAVSCTETTFLRGMALIKATRDMGVPNVFGGVFSTFAPELVMKYSEVDMICIGEGENALVDLANCLADGKDCSSVTNLWIRQKDGDVRRNQITNPVDINNLPIVTDMGIFGEDRFYRPLGGKIRRLLPVETHRGCPYTCSFCNSPAQNRMYGGNTAFFRKKSIDMIRQEIENHIKDWQVEYIYFWADTFLAWSNREFDEFCEMYSDIRLPFWCQTRIETIDEYRIKKLKEVGLNRISFGLEHGNENFRRDVVKREYSNEDAIRRLQSVAENEIAFAVNNIIGFPDETRELAFDTIEINRQFNSDTVLCSTYMPFHGTELREYAEKKGYIAPGTICSVSNSDESMLTMPQWDKKDIANLRNDFAMYLKFPKERWTEINKAETDPEIFEKLSAEFIEMCWANPRANIEEGLAEAVKGIIS